MFTYLVSHLTPQSVVSFAQRISLRAVQRWIRVGSTFFGVAFLWISTCAPPLTSFAFTVTIVITKKVISIVASQLFANFDRSQNFYTSSWSSSGDELAIGSTIMIYIRSGSEPQLSTILSTRVHDREIVQTWLQYLLLLLYDEILKNEYR